MTITIAQAVCRPSNATKSQQVWIGVVAVAAMLMFTLAGRTSAIGPAGPGWEPRELVATGIDPNDQAGGDRILAFDHHGEPGIAFKGAMDFGDIQYARDHAGIGWAAQDLFPSTGTVGRGAFASLAFDRHERPAISFRSADGQVVDSSLRFSHFDGQDWQHQIVESIQNQNVGTWTSLAFDREGRPAIVYLDESNDRLRFAYDHDGDFDFSGLLPETIDAFGGGVEANYVSLGFDPLNRPMVSYVTTDNELYFAMKETLGWLVTAIDTNEITFETASSLAIDPDTGYPAIAYTAQGGSASLKYAQWDGNDWNLATVDAVGSTGAQPSLAFDPTDGNPAIAYHRLDSGDLKIAWHDGTLWQDSVVDPNSGGTAVGLSPSIAFREFGVGDRVAAIAYHDDSGNVFYIEDPPIVSVPEPAAALLISSGTAVTLLHRRRRSARQFICDFKRTFAR